MEIQEYLEELKSIQQKLLSFIECEENNDENLSNIILFLKEKKIQEDRYRLKLLLHLLSKIIKNHNRRHNFFDKIEKLLLFFEDQIKQSYSNREIFKIFKSNKRILLFLLNANLLEFDQSIASILLSTTKYKYMKYFEFFYKELKPFTNKEFNNIPENFDEKRKIGENDLYVCSLIRNDLIDDFIIFVNKNILPLNTRIKPSIFETNEYLLRNDTTLIEYAAFFGSIQIYKYLRLNLVTMNSLLWFYAIHGKNPEIIHLIEEDHIKPANESFTLCYKEAIKCHHNDIAIYFENNFEIKNTNYFISEPITTIFYNHNYELIPYDIDNQMLFYYACYCNYYNLVKLLINLQKVELNKTMKENSNHPALYFAAKKNNQDILNFLLSQDQIRICPFCFLYCEKLTEINLPNTLTEIGNFAFKHCSSLVEITIPLSVKSIGIGTFSYCKHLVKVTILSQIISINECTFNECISLEKIIFPSTVIKIDKNAFSECQKLTEIIIPSSVKFIGSYSFWGCNSLNKITIPSSVNKICSGAFRNCKSLTKINIPSTVKSINDYTFYSCEKLKEIEIPSSVKSIGECSFCCCYSLTQINIPSSVTRIGEEAFYSCSGLEKIKIPSSVTEIERCCFSYCKSLKEIKLNSFIKSIGEEAFIECSSLVKITIPSSVTSIGNSAFSRCSSLTQISIPSSVTKIGDNAFNECSSLEQITIPSSVTSIGNSAFSCCSSLIQVSFETPSSLTSIGKRAFRKCTSLKQISIPSTVTSIGNNIFHESSSLIQISIPLSLRELIEPNPNINFV